MCADNSRALLVQLRAVAERFEGQLSALFADGIVHRAQLAKLRVPGVLLVLLIIGCCGDAHFCAD